MQRFKLISAMALALILSLALAATAAAAPNKSAEPGPHGLTARLCGDAVCLDWNLGNKQFTDQRVLHWAGNRIHDRYTGQRETIGLLDNSYRMPLDQLNLEPTEHAGQTATYSFQIVGVAAYAQGPGGITRNYSNHVTIELPRPVIAPPPSLGPTNLTAERCGDAVCLNWTPGGDFETQKVLGWEGTNIYDHRENVMLDVGTASQVRIPLRDLNMTPVQYLGYNMEYTFLVVGASGYIISTDYSNRASLFLPRPILPAESDPTNLSIARCGDNICLSWTPGAGNYHFQAIKFWKTHDPEDRRYHGGVAIIPAYLSEYEFTPGDMNRRPRGDDSAVSYTFHVEAIVGALRQQDYVGYTNTATIEVPAP